VRHRVPSHFNWTLPLPHTGTRVVISDHFSLGSNQVRCVLSRGIDWHSTTQHVLTLFILCSPYFQQCYIAHLQRVLCFWVEERATGCLHYTTHCYVLLI